MSNLIKPREYFFIGPEGNKGVKFKSGNIPPEFTFREFLDSIWFKLDPFPSDDEAIRTRMQIDALANILLNGIYWGTDVQDCPETGLVNIIASKDISGNFTYIASYPDTGVVYVGTRKYSENPIWTKITSYEELYYSIYKIFDPENEIGTPGTGLLFSGAGKEDGDNGLFYLWIKEEDGTIHKIFESLPPTPVVDGVKEYHFVVNTNEQDSFTLDENIDLADTPFINGFPIYEDSGKYTIADDTITFNPPLLQGDHLLINNIIRI